MNVLTIDFETYYDTDFSLTKLTTEEYVRGDEFEVIGVSVQVNDGEPEWFSGTHSETKAFLHKFNFADNIALAHNAMFDAAILSWQFDITPKRWMDTLSMARALHGTEVGGSLKALAERYKLGVKGTEVVNAKGKRRLDFSATDLSRYAEYCCNDTALTYALMLRLMPEFPPVELKLIDLTIRMFSEPQLHLSTSVLNSHLKSVQHRKQQLMDGMLMQGYAKEDLMSNPKLAQILTSLGVKPPMKVSLTTGKETYAFAKNDDEFKALLEHESPLVQAIVSARLGVKSTLEETRTERFIGIANRGPMPVPLRYYAAHTGRWGGDDKLNLQNLPRGSALKHAIVAPLGYVICDSDSSQIEARTLAWLADQDDLVEAFENGQDVYKIMASAIYNKPEADITKDERFVGKTTILGSGYGMGATKFQAQLRNFGVEIDEKEAQRIISKYRETYPAIPTLWRKSNEVLDWISSDKVGYFGRGKLLKVEGKSGIRLPNGLYMRYPNLRKVKNESTGEFEYVYDSRKGVNKIYGGKVVENVCQALARIVIGEQMLMIAKKYKVVMTVHDAVACLIPQQEASNGKEYVELCMRLRPKWAADLPLNCEAGVGHDYGEC
jgi:DNA polymerase